MSDKNIEIKNTRQEILEIVNKCNNCGLCKANDSLYLTFREESLSPRGFCNQLKSLMFDHTIFEIPLTGACKESCPFKIDIDEAIKRARKILNLKNKQNPINKKIVEKIKEKINPFEN